MAPKVTICLFQGHLQQLLKEIPGRTYKDFLNLHLKFKETTNFVEVVDKKYDLPKLTKNDLYGYEAKKRKQKNKLYTWIKNQCFKTGDGIKKNFCQLKNDWEKFADANPGVVLDYIRHKPRLLSNLKEAFVPVVVLADINRSGKIGLSILHNQLGINSWYELIHKQSIINADKQRSKFINHNKRKKEGFVHNVCGIKKWIVLDIDGIDIFTVDLPSLIYFVVETGDKSVDPML